MKKTELLVIGGGPGGYTAAIRAAQLGKKVTLVEKEQLGGTCLNRGCIPTKVLLQAAELLHRLEKAPRLGVKVEGYQLDLDALRRQKNRIVKILVGGVGQLLKGNGVEVIRGEACFKDKNTVIVDENQEIQAEMIIIAVGSTNVVLNIPGMDLPGVINSDEALKLENIPSSLAIIGGGVIGVEFAEIYRSMGVAVTILEALPEIIPMEDHELSRLLRKLYTQKGVSIHTSAFVREIRQAGTEKEVLFSVGEKEESLKVEQVLVAVGRRPNLDRLGLDMAGIAFDKKGITVNEHLETNIPGVYAIGDAANSGGIQLAHVAFYEGEKVAEHIAGLPVAIDYRVVPRCIFSIPEVSAVGITEEEAAAKGLSYKVGRFPLVANGKSRLMDETEGFIKIIAGAEYDEILGIHLIGPAAAELVTEAALALKLECTVEEIIETIHVHPTVGESYREAAMDVLGRAIHFKS